MTKSILLMLLNAWIAQCAMASFAFGKDVGKDVIERRQLEGGGSVTVTHSKPKAKAHVIKKAPQNKKLRSKSKLLDAARNKKLHQQKSLKSLRTR